ncbi:MAG: hypothetical protein ACI3W6_00120 [Clostridia bacterium]
MRDIIVGWISLFAAKTEIPGKLVLEAGIPEVAWLILGILLILAGMKLYRLLSSLLMFGATAIVLCVLMGGKADWGAIVTAFTITGCLLGYLAYNWKLTDAVVISGLAAAGVLWGICPVWWVAAIAGILAAVFTGFFPVAGVTFFTAAAGSALIGAEFPHPFLLILMTMGGTAVQVVLFGRKQKLFKKTMPDKVRFWMQQKKKTRTQEKH